MCKRNRPKYKVGDILEDYAPSKENINGDIVHWLVAEVKFIPNNWEIWPKRKKHTRRESVIAKKLKQKPRYKSSWEYYLKILTKESTLEDWTLDYKSLEQFFTIKKVG